MAKRKKGLSYEEKRERTLGVYHSRLEVFNLKEMEKLASEKGVISQAVKEINQSLVDDNLVEAEKIGSGMFFWSFPSKRFQTLTLEIKQHEEEIERCKSQTASTQQRIQAETATRQPSDGRKRKLAEYQELKTLHERQKAQEAHLKENDPKVIAALEKSANDGRDAANRWTDNLWQIKSWLVKKKNVERKRADQMLGLSADFDYVV
mmetsp:Transcript_5004/g.19999  ORF Transcript_5004/g.19999 Transcript_5004/m.19999 type:complete len:206 (-) Transcript_5004:146-763(-)|eukprot:scaffold1642_cov252-Pinguiococcus_pyrenoidosus.AAC.45